jgi:hypothetical protein
VGIVQKRVPRNCGARLEPFLDSNGQSSKIGNFGLCVNPESLITRRRLCIHIPWETPSENTYLRKAEYMTSPIVPAWNDRYFLFLR